VLRPLFNGSFSGSSRFRVPASLKMSESVIKMVLVAKNITWTQAHRMIDALDGKIRVSAQRIRRTEQAMRIGKIGTGFDSPSEGIHHLQILPVCDSTESLCNECPRFVSVAGKSATNTLGSLCEGGIPIFPSLNGAPRQANGPHPCACA
jgi:hypothetical protein